MTSNRQLKVGETIKRALAPILNQELHFTSLNNTSVTISKVLMTADLSIADIYILPLYGSEISKHKLVEILNDIAPKIRYLLSKKVAFKKMSILRFKIDNSFAESSRIENLLKK